MSTSATGLRRVLLEADLTALEPSLQQLADALRAKPAGRWSDRDARAARMIIDAAWQQGSGTNPGIDALLDKPASLWTALQVLRGQRLGMR